MYVVVRASWFEIGWGWVWTVLSVVVRCGVGEVGMGSERRGEVFL